MAEPPPGETEARDALAGEFYDLLRADDRDPADAVTAVRLANAALAHGWAPGTWARAVGRLSTVMGETGAPWADICPTECTDHHTCTAMRGILPFLAPADWRPAHARGGRRAP